MTEDELRHFANILLDEHDKRHSQCREIIEGDIITRTEATKIFKVSGTTLWRLEKEGKLKPYGKRGKIILYRKCDIENFLNNN